MIATSVTTIAAPLKKQSSALSDISPVGKDAVSINENPVDITVENAGNIIRLSYHISDYTYKPVNIQGHDYVTVALGKESNIDAIGMPDLPRIPRSILIPDTAKMSIRVIDTKYTEYNNVWVAPSKGTLSRLVNPADVPYSFDRIYREDAAYPQGIAELSTPYVIRDFRGQVVTIYPFHYNPVRHTLQVYSDITVEVFPDGADAVNIIERSGFPELVDTDFIPLYEDHFLNYNTMSRYTPVGEQGKMLVITYGSFYSAMLPFVQWKNMKGVPTTMVNVTQAGSTAAAIKTYITNFYNTNGLTFVLLVGDLAQIPTFTAVSGESDPTYSYIVGSDHYPDIFVGRFSAQTVAQVQTQVERSVEYEKYPQAGATWYQKGIGIGSEYGTGDDNEYDYQHIRNIRTDLLTYGYSAVDEFYGGSQGGNDSSGEPTPAMISAALNNGRGIINYCGHGSETSWGTSSFSNSNIYALTNDNKLPFIWSVACVNGDFSVSECFAEAWMRSTHAGEPIGAIATFMSSINQYWNPPMAAQDEFVDILIGSYVNNRKNTFGGISENGCMLMNDQYGSDGYDMTDTWHVFGDPSLQVRTKMPVAMTVTHDSSIPPGATTFAVHVYRVNGALCALSRNYVLLGYAYANSTGDATIQLSQPLSGTENVTLVVTAYNKIPYMTSIPVGSVTPSAPTQPTDVTPWHTDANDLYKGIGGKGIQYTYQSTSTETGGDLYFTFYWGDTTSTVVGPVSGAASVSHAYGVGTFSITVTVKHGATGTPSDPSPARSVNMFKLGDVQGDGWVTFADIDPFVAALSGKTAFYATNPTMYWYTADCNLNNDVTFADIDPFVALIGT